MPWRLVRCCHGNFVWVTRRDLSFHFLMRLKAAFLKAKKSTKAITCVGYNNDEDVYYCGDDHLLVRWNSNANEAVTVCELSEDLYPTDMHWFSKTQMGRRKQSSDLLLITSADGKFHLFHKNGRLEKSVESHKGATLIGRWSYDGAGILTAGEDGQAKIWSRSGMLRSTIIQGNVPIYTAAWGPDSNEVVAAQGKTLVVKPLAPNTKPTRWRAHDGLVLKVVWNQNNGLIVSGGEDCKYKVWDSTGKQIYCSASSEYPVTSLSWAPGGEIFAVGSFNTLRLCDKLGWSHSLDKINSGSIYAMSWSSDGTQLAGACSSGNVILAQVVERRLEWENFEVVLSSRKTVTVRNVLNEAVDRLDFSERVAKMALGFGHFVVSTPTQCHIFVTSNWNTPFIFEVKEGPASMITLCCRHFLLVERSVFNIYTYEGKLVCSPKIPGIQPDVIDSSGISLSADTLAVTDKNDEKLIHLVDIASSRQGIALPPIHHVLGVTRVALSQAGSTEDRQLAFLDSNRDLYICYVYGSGERKVSKLAVMVQSLVWNPEVNILAGLQDSMLTVWLFPMSLHIDRHLLKKSSLCRDMSEFGRSLCLVNFVGSQLNLRRLDGAMVSCAIAPYSQMLHGFVSGRKWNDALRLCRFVNEEQLWACLASMACHFKDISAAEEAFAAIGEFEKVSYLQHIRKIPLRSLQHSYLALLSGNKKEAENILLVHGFVFRAIIMNLDSHSWTRALELAVKHRTHVDTVLIKRSRYLQTIGKEETNDLFLRYESEVKIDSQKIKEKIEAEYLNEKKKEHVLDRALENSTNVVSVVCD